MKATERTETAYGYCGGCREDRELDPTPVRVRDGGRYATARYCHECSPMIRAFNARGRA